MVADDFQVVHVEQRTLFVVKKRVRFALRRPRFGEIADHFQKRRKHSPFGHLSGAAELQRTSLKATTYVWRLKTASAVR